MPPKRTTRSKKPLKPSASAAVHNPGHHTSTRLNKETSNNLNDSSSEDSDDQPEDDLDNTGKKATIAQPTPSVPSELAITQGRTAFDVRYFFIIPDKTCHRCM